MGKPVALRRALRAAGANAYVTTLAEARVEALRLAERPEESLISA
jgi:hypothetical protein